MVVLIELLKKRPLTTLVRMAALGLIIVGLVKAVSPDVDGVMLLVAVVAIELAFLLGIVGGITAVTRVVVRRRRTKERRHLASLNGWRCDARDPDLPAALGGTDYRLVNAYGHVTCVAEPVPATARAHAVVRGEVKGIAFAAFDYFHPGAFPLAVTTAWLIRLPHPLPRFVSPEVFWSTMDETSPPQATEEAGAPHDELAMRTHPEFVRDVVTDELVTFTRERLPSWWVDGHVLAATFHTSLPTHRRLGFSARELGRGIESMLWLARHLASPTLAPHASPPTSPTPSP
jgi:hypothetical protein